jgi:spermidine synthase
MPNKAIKTRKITGQGVPVIVFERGDYRGLVMAESPELIQGYRNQSRALDFRFEYLEAHLAATFVASKPKKVLCLGLGVGAIPHLLKSLYPAIHIDAVELNDTVVHAAYTHFGLNTLTKVKVYTQCAADFLHRCDSSIYDLVFADCYDAFGIPAACRSQAFFGDTKKVMTTGGLLIANLIPKKRGVEEAFLGWKTVFRGGIVIPGVRKSNRTFVGRRDQPIDVEAALTQACIYEAGSSKHKFTSTLQRAISADRYRD